MKAEIIIDKGGTGIAVVVIGGRPVTRKIVVPFSQELSEKIMGMTHEEGIVIRQRVE